MVTARTPRRRHSCKILRFSLYELRIRRIRSISHLLRKMLRRVVHILYAPQFVARRVGLAQFWQFRCKLLIYCSPPLKFNIDAISHKKGSLKQAVNCACSFQQKYGANYDFR